MTLRTARMLVSLYPSHWRGRYAEEFMEFLQAFPATPRTLLNVLRSAIEECFREKGEVMLRASQDPMMLMVYAVLMAFAAATNLYWMVDDSPFAVLLQSDRLVSFCWLLIAAGGLLVFGAAMVAGLRILAARKEIVSRLLPLLVPYAATFCWFAAVLWYTQGHWAPMPWAVAGQEPGWPAIETRWILALISLVLLVTTLALTAVGIRRILHNTALAGQAATIWKLTGTKAAVLTISISIVLMVCGCVGFGLLINGWDGFHQPGGGILNTSAFESWLISCALFAASGIAAIRGTKQMLSAGKA